MTYIDDCRSAFTRGVALGLFRLRLFCASLPLLVSTLLEYSSLLTIPSLNEDGTILQFRYKTRMPASDSSLVRIRVWGHSLMTAHVETFHEAHATSVMPCVHLERYVVSRFLMAQIQ